jgi:spore coat protein U-like protein
VEDTSLLIRSIVQSSLDRNYTTSPTSPRSHRTTSLDRKQHQRYIALAESTNNTINVGVTVVNTCALDLSDIGFNFPDYNASKRLGVKGSTSIDIHCTKGTEPISIMLSNENYTNGSFRTMKHYSSGHTSLLKYKLYSDANYSQTWQNVSTKLMPDYSNSHRQKLTINGQPLKIYAKVLAGQDIPVGTYQDTLNLIVNY